MKNKLNVNYKTNVLYGMAILMYALLLTFLISSNILACDITILPSSGQYNVGDEVSLKIERIQTCGRCILPLDQTKFNIENAKIIEIGNWTKEGIKDVVYVKLKFTEIGDVKFEVIRACTKNYNVARANFTVVSTASTMDSNSSSNISQSSLSPSNQEISNINSNINNTESLLDDAANGSDSGTISISEKEITDLNDTYSEVIGKDLEENITNNNIQEDQSGLLNFIKSNLSYILIAFFLIAGFVSYILKLKFIRNILLLFSIIFLGFYLGGCPCIVGTTFNIFNIKNANIIYLVLLSFIPIATSFIWGRWFCGWFCPIGAFQKFLYSIKIKNPKNIFYKLNGFLKKNDKILRYTKLVIFAIFGYFYISKGYNLFCHYEPFKAIFAFNGSLVNVTIAFVVFLLATINQRFFCKYLCPLGGILKITSRFALKKIKIDSDCCTGCKICTKDICPMDALKCDEKNNKIDIDHSECIRCLKCVDACKAKAYKV